MPLRAQGGGLSPRATLNYHPQGVYPLTPEAAGRAQLPEIILTGASEPAPLTVPLAAQLPETVLTCPRPKFRAAPPQILFRNFVFFSPKFRKNIDEIRVVAR